MQIKLNSMHSLYFCTFCFVLFCLFVYFSFLRSRRIIALVNYDVDAN
jgi:hypothetical protein